MFPVYMKRHIIENYPVSKDQNKNIVIVLLTCVLYYLMKKKIGQEGYMACLEGGKKGIYNIII